MMLIGFVDTPSPHIALAVRRSFIAADWHAGADALRGEPAGQDGSGFIVTRRTPCYGCGIEDVADWERPAAAVRHHRRRSVWRRAACVSYASDNRCRGE